jgi:hypothetical protein
MQYCLENTLVHSLRNDLAQREGFSLSFAEEPNARWLKSERRTSLAEKYGMQFLRNDDLAERRLLSLFCRTR